MTAAWSTITRHLVNVYRAPVSVDRAAVIVDQARHTR
jgi:hypothetical protein